MLRDKNISDQLCRNTIFQGLTPEQIRSILPCIVLNIKSYGSQECVFDKGENIEGLGVVLDGELKVCDDSSAGAHTTVSNIQKNQLIGEDFMFSTSAKVPYKVIAQKAAQVVYLNGEFFLDHCDNSVCEHKSAHHKVVRNMFRLLSDRTLLLNKKIAYLTASDLKTKIAMYLCELYELNCCECFNMPLNRDRLADFFSVARPSLSRELTNLKNLNVIDFHRSSIKILDLDTLYQIANNNG